MDFLVAAEDRLVPIEARHTATLRPEMAAGITELRRDLGPRIAPGYVIHAGSSTLPLAPDVVGIPLDDL